MMKNLSANAGDQRDEGSVPGSGGSFGEGHGIPWRRALHYSHLENPMDRGIWQATVHGVAKSQTQLKWLSTHGTNLNSVCGLCITLGRGAWLLAKHENGRACSMVVSLSLSLSFKLCFKGTDSQWILDLVECSHDHRLLIFIKSSDLLLQCICSNFIVFNYTLYLKFLSSILHWN